MTEELPVAKKYVFDPPFAPERHFKAKNAPPDHYFASYKRHITHRWCSRLSAGGLPGSELAVEYLYGKYIKNLSVHSIKEPGRITPDFRAKKAPNKHYSITLKFTTIADEGIQRTGTNRPPHMRRSGRRCKMRLN